MRGEQIRISYGWTPAANEMTNARASGITVGHWVN